MLLCLLTSARALCLLRLLLVSPLSADGNGIFFSQRLSHTSHAVQRRVGGVSARCQPSDGRVVAFAVCRGPSDSDRRWQAFYSRGEEIGRSDRMD